jgi:hypothetical protein
MATEKFFVFNESGTLKRLKGRIVRFLDNEDPDNADKVAIRSSLSVPASAEGLTPANNLSDLDSAATARTNLSVNSIDEHAQANGTKVTAPALYFNGTTSVVTVADDDKLSFTDGVDDLPFSIGFKCKVDFSASGTNAVFGKYGLSAATREWWFYYTSNLIYFSIVDSSGRESFARWDVSSISGKTAHILMTFDGAGPNSSNAFTAAADGMSLYVNGVLQTPQATYNDPSYTGMANTSQALWFGKSSSSFGVGHYSAFVFYNMSLSASQATVAKNGDLGFSEEWAGALGGAYSSDFSAGVDGWTASAGTAAGNVDSIGGQNDWLRLTVDGTTNQHLLEKSSIGTSIGKRYRLSFDYYIPSSNSNVNGFDVNDRLALGAIGNVTSATLDAVTRFSGEYVATNAQVGINALDNGVASFTDAGADDVLYIRNVTVTEIGTLADFRAEDYNESASKLLDRSSNNFVGVGTSVTLTGNQRHISADTIDLKNLPTSSAGLSAGEVWSNGGVLTVV